MMKRPLNGLARELDAFCGRMNDGLMAVAVLLGFLVMTMSVIRAQELLPKLLASMPADYSVSAGE